MGVYWPLIDVRRDAFNKYELSLITESLVVPAVPDDFGDLSIRLREVPSRVDPDGQPYFYIVINSNRLEPIEAGTPAVGEVFVDFTRGILVFHSSYTGLAVSAEYYAMGSLS